MTLPDTGFFREIESSIEGEGKKIELKNDGYPIKRIIPSEKVEDEYKTGKGCYTGVNSKEDLEIAKRVALEMSNDGQGSIVVEDISDIYNKDVGATLSEGDRYIRILHDQRRLSGLGPFWERVKELRQSS